MKYTLTSLLSLTLVLFGVGNAIGQAGPALGDDFVFFVEGVNPEIPEFDFNILDNPDPDPINSSDKVLNYNHGNWAFGAFRFPSPNVGRDLSQNQMDGDVLHVKIWVDPENAGKPRVQLMFEDKTDGEGANDGSADIPFRLVWRIPEEMRNGEWHEVSIPLPPATYDELENAKADGELDELAMHWKYAGGWSSGGFGVGVSDEMGPNTTDNPQLWKEFEWTNVQNLGIHFDNADGGGPIYLDDVYIGAEGLDLSGFTGLPDPVAGVSVEATGKHNTVSWAAVPGVSGYRIYHSMEEITDVTSGVILGDQVGSETTSFEHSIEIPHASLSPVTLYYAVTTLSESGVENPDITMSTASVANEDFPVQPHIPELRTKESEHLDDLLFDDSFVDVMSGFPEGLIPFELNTMHFSLGDGGSVTTDEDLSGKLWAGYTVDPPGLYIYVEVTDDQISLQSSAGNPSDGWMHDSIELGWGNYDVRQVDGGGIFVGSPHQDIMRGDFPDYQFRILGQGDGSKDGTVGVTFAGWSIDAVPPGSGAIYDQLMDGSQVIGYKLLSIIPMDQIQNEEMMDAPSQFPSGSEIGYFPFNFVLNDGDGGTRDNQIQWTIKSNADGQWWNTPAQWATVALVGRDAQNPVMAEIEFSMTADGSAITELSLSEGESQAYYVKLSSQPSADVAVAIAGQEGSDLTIDNDDDPNTVFSGLTFTPENWNIAQPVMVMAAIDDDRDDDTVTLTHTSTSTHEAFDGLSWTLSVTVSDFTVTNLESQELPTEVALEQNYPNPFNPSTLIQFALPASEAITLRIFDSMGRTVATLLNQVSYGAGRHSVEFDASGLSSGIYLYRLETDSSVMMTRRMLLIK